MKKLSKIIYGVFSGVTVLAFSLLTIYGLSGKSENTNKENVETKLITTDSLRREYLVNESIDLTDVQLEINKDLYVNASDCKVTYDFSSAGDKVVSLSYEYEEKNYVSNFMVEVFSVRHLDIREKTLSKNKDDSWNTSALIVWAELNKPAVEFEKPIEFSDIDDTVIILNENQYQIDIKEEDREGYYTAKIRSGLAESSFAFITNTDDPKVNSIDRILTLTNASGTEDTLTLFVTESSTNFASPTGQGTIEVRGVYVLEDAYKNKTRYDFAYALNGWTSDFKSASFNQGLKDYQGYLEDGDAYRVEVNGLTFFATGSEWHKAILNM